MAKSDDTPQPKEQALSQISAPKLPYLPNDSSGFRPRIGLVGCGGIAAWHLKAYRQAGYDVAAFCDLDPARARERRDEFYPDADLYENFSELLARDDLQVIDVTTHPHQRPEIVEAALLADKHVLSQKPFVLDLPLGRRLADLADERNRLLAVNQNGRWAPHFSYLRAAVDHGLLGEIEAAHFAVHWNHSWVEGTPFEEVRHLILYDFAVHWFDMLTCVMQPRTPKRVFASFTRSKTQTVRPPLLAQALVEYDDAQATLVFDGHTRCGPLDETYVTGSKGTLHSIGESYENQQLTLTTDQGYARPELKGTWFPDGFHGAMAELCAAIADQRPPTHSARNNLQTLALCFAAVASADSGQPVVPGTIEKMPE